jgi:hypothetical protein
MKLMPFVIAFAVSAGVLGSSREGMSTDSDGYYWAFFPASCGDFVDARRTNSDKFYKWWLAGYLTALNDQIPDTYNLVGSDDLSGPLLWLENWCSKNPLKGMGEGARELVLELYPHRQQAKPK